MGSNLWFVSFVLALSLTASAVRASSANDAGLDTMPPVISPQSDVWAEATNSRGAIISGSLPATQDNVDGAGSATCMPSPGSLFAIGRTQVTCTAVDRAGNAAIPVSFGVTVSDTTPPTIRAPADVTQATDQPFVYVSLGYPSVSDAVDGSPKVTQDAPGKFFAGTTTNVTWTATDDYGNFAQAIQRITVTAASGTPSPTPSASPTLAPTATPTATVSPSVTPAPTVSPTASVSPVPSVTASPIPIVSPTSMPTPSPTFTPSATPSLSPNPTAAADDSQLWESEDGSYLPGVEPGWDSDLVFPDLNMPDLVFPAENSPAEDAIDVSGSFSDASTEFVLTYSAPAIGVDGELTYDLPLNFSDYEAGLIQFYPEPKDVSPGSVKAAWEVALDGGAPFKVTVRVARKMDPSVLELFSVPEVNAKRLLSQTNAAVLASQNESTESAAEQTAPPSQTTGFATVSTSLLSGPGFVVLLSIGTVGLVFLVRHWLK